MKRAKIIALATLFATGILGASAYQTQAGPFTFTKIADESDVAPGSQSNYASFQNPYIDNGQVAFIANNNLYSDVGGSGIASFGNSGNQIDISNGTVAFVDGAGIKTTTGGAPTLVIDATTGLPGVGFPPGPNGLTRVRYGSGSVVYSSVGTNGAIFSNRSGTPQTVATGGTIPRPAYSVPFGNLSAADIDGTEIVFRGANSPFVDDGIYIDNGASLNAVATVGDTAPNGNGTFTGFGAFPVISDGEVAFQAGSTGAGPGTLNGVYKTVGGVVTLVADENTVAPGKSDAFEEFVSETLSIDNGNVAFMGDTNPLFGERGIYTDIGGMLQKVIDLDDVLVPGRVLTGLFIGPGALDGNSIVFRANFLDGNDGIYRADLNTVVAVSAPSSVAVFIMCVLGMRLLRRYRIV